MLGDGNGEFAAAAGLELDGSAFGLGTRSQRYAAILEDGVVRQLMVEPDPLDDPVQTFEESRQQRSQIPRQRRIASRGEHQRHPRGDLRRAGVAAAGRRPRAARPR